MLPSSFILNSWSSGLCVTRICASLRGESALFFVGWFSYFPASKNFWRRVLVSSFGALALNATDLEVEVPKLRSASSPICLWARFCCREWENLSFRWSSVRTWLSSIPTLVTTRLISICQHLECPLPTWDTFGDDTQSSAWEGRCPSLDILGSSSSPELVWSDRWSERGFENIAKVETMHIPKMSPEEGSARVACDRPKVKTWRHHRVKVSHSSESIFTMHHLRPSWTGTQVELQVAVCWSLLRGITPHWVVSSVSIKCIVKLWQFVIVNESSPHRSKIPIRPSAPHTRHSPSFASVLLVVVNNKSIFFPFYFPFFPFF